MIHRIKFIGQGGKCFPGEVAGFPLDEAKFYVETKKVAVWVDEPPNGSHAAAEAIEEADEAPEEVGGDEETSEEASDAQAADDEASGDDSEAGEDAEEAEEEEAVELDPKKVEKLHSSTIGKVGDLVAAIDSLEELAALRDSEVAHPRYQGGRKGALEAIDARMDELKASA